MKTKTFKAPLQFSKEEGKEGHFTAVFATLNVKDLDDDVTLPGAFRSQPVIIESWNHDRGLPSGKGVIQSDEEKAWVEGQFFLDTQIGTQNYHTVKNLGPLVEWSYTFNIEDASFGKFGDDPVRFLRKMDVAGVGPVTRGAGIDTRTIDIKQSKDNEEADDEGEIVHDKPSTAGPFLAIIEILETEMEEVNDED